MNPSDSFELKVAAACLAGSLPGITSLCATLSSMLPKSVSTRNGHHFAAMTPTVAWVGTYTETPFCDELLCTITLRRVDRKLRRVTLRGSESFETLSQATTFAREVVAPTQPSALPRSAESWASDAEEEITDDDIRHCAREAISAPIMADEAAADRNAMAAVGL